MGWRNYGYRAYGGYGGYGGFRPYVSVGERRATAAAEMRRLEKKGRVVSPVKIAGRKIATSFWGKGWCEHLESYSDFSNRLPRGRTYVRNGSVVDLQIKPGKISAMVMGSELYHVEISITKLRAERWKALKQCCAGKIKSVLELLKGGISAGVMEVMSHRENGMFPAPAEIKKECSCPDYAGLCKHLAAVLYGVGSRLDAQPELLFTLRQVDPAELIAQAADSFSQTPGAAGTQLEAGELADVFGIDLVESAAPAPLNGQSSIKPAPLRRRRVAEKKSRVIQRASAKSGSSRQKKTVPRPSKSRLRASLAK